MRLTGERNYALISVVLGKDISEASVNRIFDLADGNLINDNREEKSDVNGSYWVFRLAAYGFLAIISLITVLNIMNSISMGVSARIKQYGAMRAVGMESRQVTKMIAAEAITYAAQRCDCGYCTRLDAPSPDLCKNHYQPFWGNMENPSYVNCYDCPVDFGFLHPCRSCPGKTNSQYANYCNY